MIALLTPGAQRLGPFNSALYRVVEITFGSFVSLGVSLVLLPARAHGLVVSGTARALNLLADLLGDWLAVLAGGRDRAASRSCRMVFAQQWGASKSLRRGP